MPDADTRRRLKVACTDRLGRPLRVRGLARWLERAAPARARGAVAVVLVSDAVIRDLNRRYRGRDRATDVLSFSYESRRSGGSRRSRGAAHRSSSGAASGHLALRARQTGPARAAEPAHDRPFLGDIVIARGVAAAQARRAGHSTATELRLLALHGLLHLLGYDHENDAGQMGRLEARLRARGGLPVGLIERTRARARP